MPTFSFGGETKERLEIDVLGYERAASGEYYDDNWLRAVISASVGGFSGKFNAAFLTSELLGFRDELQTLYNSLRGVARFVTMEEQLFIDLTGNGCGGILLKAIALDAPGNGNRLQFELTLDQTCLLSALEGLNEVIDRFPVRAG